MKHLALTTIVIAASMPLCAQTGISVAQLQQGLQSPCSRNNPDAALATRLGSVELKQELPDDALQIGFEYIP